MRGYPCPSVRVITWSEYRISHHDQSIMLHKSVVAITFVSLSLSHTVNEGVCVCQTSCCLFSFTTYNMTEKAFVFSIFILLALNG